MMFVENRGQLNPEVRYFFKGDNAIAFFAKKGVTIVVIADHLKPILRISFSNSGAVDSVRAVGRTTGVFNYFVGDKSRWRTNVPCYARLVYKHLWPGVDVIYYGDGGALKYDVRISPGGDASSVRMKYEGARSIKVSPAGDLIVNVGSTEMREKKPVIYQWRDGRKVLVTGGFVVRGNEVGFRVGRHDHSLPLIIDPQTDLLWSSFLGGSDDDVANAVAVGSDGSVYVAGYTKSADFPTPGGLDTVVSNIDAFVAKMAPDGRSLIYATFIGGSADDGALGIAVDSSGSAYVCGYTSSADFPAPVGYDPTYNGYTDGFVLKLAANGSSIVYSTFLGGSDDSPDRACSVYVDSFGCAYVVGQTGSSDFPVTAGAYDMTYNDDGNGYADAFVTKLSPDGVTLQYSTFLGGSNGFEEPRGIAVDSSGCAYVTGATSASNFPTFMGYDATFNGGTDVFVTKLNASGSGLVYSTYIGGTGSDSAYALDVDASGNAYVVGSTLGFTSPYYPTTAGAFDTTVNGDFDVFVTKLNANGSALVYSTFLGGNYSEWAYGVAVDSEGCAYVVGGTLSSNFPVTPDAFDLTKGTGMDVFLTKLNAAGSALHYSTFIGNSGSDVAYSVKLGASGSVYVAGYTASTDFPATPFAYMTSYGGGAHDAFVFRMYVPESLRLSAIKRMANNSRVETHKAVVTAAFVDPAASDYFYIESDDRTSGIRVQKEGHGLQHGVRVDVTGLLKTNTDGERYVDASSISVRETTEGVRPLGLSNYFLGGSGFYNPVTGTGQAGVAGGTGLNNIGLFVRIWGNVTQIGGSYFYLDDGSGLKDGTQTDGVENIGIRVSATLPVGCKHGDFVEVTGVSSCFRATPPSSPILRRILVSDISNIRKLAD